MNPDDPLYEQYQKIKLSEMLYELKGDNWKLDRDDLWKYRLTAVQENEKQFREKLKTEEIEKATKEFNKYITGGGTIKPAPLPDGWKGVSIDKVPVVIDIMVCPKELRGSPPRGTISWPREERKLMGIRVDELNIYILPGCRADRVYDELLSLYQRLLVCMSPDNDTWKNFFKNNVPDLEEKLKTYKKTLDGYNASVNWDLEY